MGKARQVLVLAFILLIISGCSFRKVAVNSLADALSGSTAGVFATDDLPEFVSEAVPFGLKLNESILEQTPEHKELLLSLASGYTQYAYAFVHLRADTLVHQDFRQSQALKSLAKKIYLRARGYAFRTMEVDFPGFEENLRDNPDSTLNHTSIDDVPAMYWLGLSWMGAITISMNDMALLSELGLAEKLLYKCLDLDESYGEGALHEFFISYDGSRSEVMGGGPAKARKHYERTLELNGNKKSSPHVALASSVAVREQDVESFRTLLGQALAIDVSAHPEYKLENTLSQRKAAWLLANIDEYFLLDDGEYDDD